MSVIVLISVSLLGILVSESILFAILFWSLFQPFCCYLYSLEGVYTSDPSSHTYSNTIILSNSGVSLGCVLVIRDVYRLHLLLPLYVWIIAITFLHIQIKELSGITLYMNESIYVSMFFSLLGLHLFHILIGILLIGLIVWTSCYSRSVLTFTSWILIVTSHQLSSTLQLVYWHFVDLLWLIIYYVLYN
jgi:heme/copper-type cytochrome/quinol oxidase subunit 3